MNIHEYSNALICIFQYQIKGQCLRFDLVPTFLIYVEHRLGNELFTMCTVKIQFVLWVAMETVRFHIAQMSFFFFFLEDITHLVDQSEQFGNCLGGSW